jgi:hypothetical protein
LRNSNNFCNIVNNFISWAEILLTAIILAQDARLASHPEKARAGSIRPLDKSQAASLNTA